MKKIFLLFIAFMLLGLNVMAEEKYVWKEYDDTTSTDLLVNLIRYTDKEGVIISGKYFDCSAGNTACDTYKVNQNGQISKIDANFYDFLKGDSYRLALGEKIENDYPLQKCINNECTSIEGKMVRNLYVDEDRPLVDFGFPWLEERIKKYVVEIYDNDNNVSKFGIYDSKGNEIVEPSTNYEQIDSTSPFIVELKDKTNNDYLVASIYDSHYERVTARVRADINYENLSRVDTIDSKNYYKISTGEKYKFADKSGFILDKEFSLYSWVEKIDGKLVIVEKDLQTKIYDLNGNVLISSDSELLNWSSLDSGYLLFQNAETKKFTLRTLGKILFEKELSNNVAEEENYIQDSYGNFWLIMDSGKTYDTEENQNFRLSKLASLKLMTDTVIDKTNDVTITMSEFITKNYEMKAKILSKEKTAFSEEFVNNIKLSSNKEKVIDIFNHDERRTEQIYLMQNM